LSQGVDAVRRVGEGASWVFVIDHSGQGHEVSAEGTDLVSGRTCGPEHPLHLPPGGVAVIRETTTYRWAGP
ncbi:MAG: Beta-galactosidase C-terminal domain, partial [Ornithinimicrobium sp.]|uniref:Beta-galactosidase C-terminal domain n=1 Tax=Ornithinimicrobium sp. TaxID=1977084 RepID=UPI003D9AF7D4